MELSHIRRSLNTTVLLEGLRCSITGELSDYTIVVILTRKN